MRLICDNIQDQIKRRRGDFVQKVLHKFKKVKNFIFDIDYIATGLTANLRIGIYNGEIVFNILLGNGWSDLDDLFGRPPWNFNSNQMVGTG